MKRLKKEQEEKTKKAMGKNVSRMSFTSQKVLDKYVSKLGTTEKNLQLNTDL